jgi:FimV-like protein
MISGYAPENLEKMRAELKKTIELAPNFAEGYRLLAFIDLVAGNKTDEALALLQRAVALEPGEPQHKFMLAQVYMQKRDYKAARALVESLVRTGEPELRAQAQQMLDVLSSIEARQARRDEETQNSADGNSSTGQTSPAGEPSGPPRLTRRKESGQPAAPPQGDVTLNGPPGTQLRKPGPGEEQVRGLLVRIDCTDSNIVLIVRVGERLLKLQSAGLEDIEFVTYSPDISGDMTCGTRKPENPVIVIYRPSKTARAKFDGDVLSVSFVPKEMLEAGKE